MAKIKWAAKRKKKKVLLAVKVVPGVKVVSVSHDELTAALANLVNMAETAGGRDHPTIAAGRALLDRLK